MNETNRGKPGETAGSASVIKAPVRRNFKDTVFRKLFNNKQELLELYNALNDSDYQNPDDIEIITLDNALFFKMKNDVAFLINTNEMCLVEHSSTVCLNYPLRGLLYLAKEYESIIKMRNVNILQYSLVKIPTPKCIVLYNGQLPRPERETLRLSDAFENREVDPCLEMTVEILNINLGKNSKLLTSCKTLGDYAILVSKIRGFMQQTEDLAQAIRLAVDSCIEQDCLRDFLIRNRVEVESMLLSEGTVEEYIDSMYEEIDRIKQELSDTRQKIADADQQMADMQEVLEQKDVSLRQKDTSLKQKDASLKQKDAEIKRLKALLAAKDS